MSAAAPSRAEIEASLLKAVDEMMRQLPACSILVLACPYPPTGNGKISYVISDSMHNAAMMMRTTLESFAASVHPMPEQVQ